MIKRSFTTLFIAFTVLLLASCASMDAGRAVVKHVGAETMDRALADASWFTCYGASVGSVRRAHEKAPKVYADFCFNVVDENLIGLETE